MAKVTATTGTSLYKTIIQGATHTFLADEPADLGGQNTGPTPAELLAAALASCTTITVKMYAARKEWPLEEVKVSVEVDYSTTPGETLFTKNIEFIGDLTEEQRTRLFTIAGKCPINKALQQNIKME